MWLDRFASHSQQSTPAGTPPQSRSYSPAPRRPYLAPPQQPVRPGLNPRSSSLSLFSPASSTASLPQAARIPNGSALKFQINDSPPPDVPDPLKVLEDIVGAPPRKGAASQDDGQRYHPAEKPAEIITEIDFGGLSLQAFAEADNETQREPYVNTYSSESVDEYDKAKDKFEDLHRSVTACDEVLKSVETYLTGFQADLGAVSAEIETLQTRSSALTTKLENRKVVEKLLGPAVEENSISPTVVKKIAEGPIDDSFLKALQELEKRTKIVNARSKEEQNVKALDDLRPLLEDLTNKAVERARDYIVAQIKALRSPSINAQIIQQQGFLKFKELYAFLAKHQPKLGDEICQAYTNTMRWYYLNHFNRYHESLSKLKFHTVDKYDALGSEETSKRSAPLLGANRTPTAPHDAFSLGRRLDLLKNASNNAITTYLVEEDKTMHYLEVPFRNFNLALIDNASFEYTFLTTYFSSAHSYHALNRTFTQIFEPTFALGQTLTKSLIDNTMDALGILLCVRLNQHFAFELQRRKVPAVESYVNATNMLLWPRFQLVMDAHCKSIAALTASLPGRPAAASLLTSAPKDTQNTAPVALTQKFANFLQGLLALSSEAADDEPVSNSLGRLRGEFDAYLVKRGKGVAEQRKRERFMFNNYSLVVTILEGTDGRLAEDIRSHFEAAKEDYKEVL
ncbi:Vps52-domain-containing protein [Saccharata proteae CBS 121410]|uniref:Vps52-domain-containing protein n=1 Tax=Saccharata proteae CBS 121410 TaxID=1314787 RepID=A0A6A5YFD9_9PEZI|nr:Vps52-domain-containing protein [Saccharata proteae CBS 121410]